MMIDKLLEADGPEPSGDTAALAQTWLQEIEDARRREKDYRREGKELVKLYEAGKAEEAPFNILFSNTETLSPAVYNSVPRPRVQQRFKDEAPLAAAAATVVRRVLEFLQDSGRGNASFDELMKSVVVEALVPGRGVTEIEYHANISQDEMGAEVVDYEVVCGREVPWDRFLHGYAKKWKDVPWVAFEYFMTKEELIENFGQEIGAAVPVTGIDKDAGEEKGDESGMDRLKVAPVYKIWDKSTRTVIFVSPSYNGMVLKSVPDPLGLSGFFPCPKPLGFMQKISSLIPVPPYQVYSKQARELNKVTLRIDKLIDALKVRGMYDSTVQDIEKVLEAGDNVLIPAANVAAMIAQGNALEKAIWLFPIKDLMPVLQELYLQRNQIKQVIYEITGIADIMRGSTAASETLGAQEIKNQWGTLRLKRSQKEVARYARDCLRLMAEVAVTKLSVPTLKEMTNLQFPMEAEKAQAQQVMAQAQAMQMPPPPQLQELLSKPSWEQLLGLLQNDLLRSYSIDIETNSTVDAEATEDKQDITELVNAMGQFLTAIGPLIQEGIMPFEIAKSMLLTIVRRYEFGPELEEQLEKMATPPPKPPDPKIAIEQQKAASADKLAQMDMALKQLDMQMKQMEMQMKERQAELDAARQRMEMQFAEREHLLRMEELDMKAVVGAEVHRQKMAQAKVKPAAKTGSH